MKARTALRTATSAEHERVDRLFSTLDLSRTGDYRRFLLAQATAYLPVEAALDEAGAAAILPDWPGRRRGDLLRRDLHVLGAAEPEPVAALAFNTQAAALGGIYVLEGSRLGGALLKREIPGEAPRQFLDAPQPPGSWRKLLELLDASLYRTDLLEAATEAAKEVFQRFEAGGLRYLETDQA